MGLQTYVGARYVPKFMGTYDPTQIYEALDVVDNGSGTSYISKKITPAGTPLTDTEYWAIYGASSGAIINLQNQINDMNDGGVSGSLQNQINTTNSIKLSRIPFRKFLFMGDSYDVVVAGHKWTDAVAANLGLDNAHYVVRSGGGLGFVSSDPSKTWGNYLINNPVSDPDTITDIVICGGPNDRDATLANLKSAMFSLDTYLHSTFTNLERVYVGFIGWSLSYANRPKEMIAAQNYQTASVQSGWRYLCGVDNILKYAGYIEDSNPSDLDHPNVNGIEALGVGIANAIATGYCSTYHVSSVTYNVDPTNFTGSSWSMSERLYDGMISIQPGDVTLTAAQNLGSGIYLIGNTAGLNDSSIPRNRQYPVQFYNVSASKWFPARIISEHAGEISLFLTNDSAVSSGQSIRLLGFDWVDILH